MTTPPKTVRALSIRQPWAGLILAGVKSIENRTWATTYRGLLVIHAGAKRDEHTSFAVQRAAAILPTMTRSTGFLGLAVLIDVHSDSVCCHPWGEPGAYHWVLTDAQPFDRAVPGRGRLGLFTVPTLVLDAARETDR